MCNPISDALVDEAANEDPSRSETAEAPSRALCTPTPTPYRQRMSNRSQRDPGTQNPVRGFLRSQIGYQRSANWQSLSLPTNPGN
jgi:hypothetical protein